MGVDILIVDDEVEFAEAFAERLRLRGFTAHIANSGEAGAADCGCGLGEDYGARSQNAGNGWPGSLAPCEKNSSRGPGYNPVGPWV